MEPKGDAQRLIRPDQSVRVHRVSGLETAVLQNLRAFISFARNRIADPHLAEDVVQESLVKALAADRKPVGDENTTAWFYRILRRSIIDVYRRRDARDRAMERFQQELPEQPTPTEERVLCRCFKRLLPALPAAYRDVLQQIDLDGRDPAAVAEELGLTRNNLTVRLHRARKHLRDALAKNCRACSKHGCLDCTCGESEEPMGCHATPSRPPRRRRTGGTSAPSRARDCYHPEERRT